MTCVKGFVFVSLFVLALFAQPVLSQDRNGDAPCLQPPGPPPADQPAPEAT